MRMWSGRAFPQVERIVSYRVVSWAYISYRIVLNSSQAGAAQQQPKAGLYSTSVSLFLNFLTISVRPIVSTSTKPNDLRQIFRVGRAEQCRINHVQADVANATGLRPKGPPEVKKIFSARQ